MLVALIIGILSCALTSRESLSGDDFKINDAAYYHHGANLLADGRGFIHPLWYLITGEEMQAADHPPLYMTYLAAFSLVGLRSIGSHQAATILLAVATVPFVACVGRRIAGRLPGVLAALLAASHPGIWSWGKILMSESMAILCVAILIATALRVRARFLASNSNRWDVFSLGAVIAFAALARAELLLCGAVVGFLCFLGRPLWMTFKWVIAVGVVTAALISPWAIFNLTRFNEPVLLSDGAGVTLSSANCDVVYNGPRVGLWSWECSIKRLSRFYDQNPTADRSDEMKFLGQSGRNYISEHLTDQPRIIGFRIARAFGFYELQSQLETDKKSDGRGQMVSRGAWYTYYALLPLSVLGAFTLRHKNRSLGIILMPLISAIITVSIAFGSTRYRAISEVTFVILGAVGIDFIMRRLLSPNRLSANTYPPS